MPVTPPSIALLAPAKVNLWLEIAGRRSDGMHELDSLFAFAAVGDRLRLAPRAEAGIALDMHGPFAPQLAAEAPERNLAWRAAALLAEALDRPLQLDMALDKRLPLGAGLGGGSADAAAVLRGLMRLWQVDAAAVDLPALALRLGADVPACLLGVPAHATGVGERLQPICTLPDHALVLVHPGVGLATAQVFGRYRFDADAPAPQGMPGILPRSFAEMLDMLRGRRNDLTAAAVAALPAVATVLEALGAQPGCALARMSGSGSACFGLFAELASARAAAARLQAAQPGWWVQAALPHAAANAF